MYLYNNVRCNMLKSLICDAFITGMLIADSILFIAAVGLFVWYFLRNKNKNNAGNNKKDNSISKVDDETYVIEKPQEVESTAPVYENDNNVVHFVNQITDINEELNNELNANTVVVNHEVEQPVKKAVAKEEIANFVEVGGEKKVKTDEEIATTANRGTNAFKNATNFINTIKSEQESDKLSSVKVSKKK